MFIHRGSQHRSFGRKTVLILTALTSALLAGACGSKTEVVSSRGIPLALRFAQAETCQSRSSANSEVRLVKELFSVTADGFGGFVLTANLLNLLDAGLLKATRSVSMCISLLNEGNVLSQQERNSGDRNVELSFRVNGLPALAREFQLHKDEDMSRLAAAVCAPLSIGGEKGLIFESGAQIPANDARVETEVRTGAIPTWLAAPGPFFDCQMRTGPDVDSQAGAGQRLLVDLFGNSIRF